MGEGLNSHRVGLAGARGVIVGRADEEGVWLAWDEPLVTLCYVTTHFEKSTEFSMKNTFS